MWKAAKRGGVSVAGFSNPGLHHKFRFPNLMQKIHLGNLNRVDELRVSLMGNFEQMQLQAKERVLG